IITNVNGQPTSTTNKVYYQYPATLSQNIFIDASNVVLSLPNGIKFNIGGSFTLNTNADIEIYSGGDVNTANGLINNLAEYAPALKVYGLPSCTNITFGGNAALTIYLYAPDTSVSFNGGPDTYDVIGAIMAKTISVNGQYHFHFDEALGSSVPFQPWIISQTMCQAVEIGSNASFIVKTSGGRADSFAWFFNQTNQLFSAPNSSTLSLTNVQLSDTGKYSMVASNSFGSVFSQPALLFVYTNTSQVAAQIGPPTVNTYGQLQITVGGVSDLYYVVQASTNLTDWKSLRTNTPPFFIIDPNAGSGAQRFFRAVYQPL
ncbi:MAG TPA: immunoglobulin domain-containing protein, partial [Candidatus Binatia bacterium]|nr:immunoglobulin domain-containing protein [Candidatus Binatia bacterium]